MKKLLIVLLAGFAATACVQDTEDSSDLPETLTIDGKGDISNGIRVLSALDFGGEVNNEFTKDFEIHAYSISAKEGAELRLDVTNKGTSRALDSNLFVYAPTDNGLVRIAKDDDSGFGKHSRIDITLRKQAEFLVVIKPENDDDRGRYRLTLECTGDSECAHVEEIDATCPARIDDMMHDCVIDEVAVSLDHRQDFEELVDQCSFGDALHYHEVMCQLGDREWCFEDFDTFFVDKMMVNCHAQLANIYVIPNTLNLRDEGDFTSFPRTLDECDNDCTINNIELRYTDSPDLAELAESARHFAVYPAGVEVSEMSIADPQEDFISTLSESVGEPVEGHEFMIETIESSVGAIEETAKVHGFGPFGSEITLWVLHIPSANRLVLLEYIDPE